MTPELSSPETAERVLSAIAGADAPTSVRALAAELGIGRSTANRAVSRLIAEGRVAVVRKGTGDGYPTRYEVTEP